MSVAHPVNPGQERVRQFLRPLALPLAAVLVILQMVGLTNTVRESRTATPSPIEYLGEARPEKSTYHPGEVVRFYRVRRATEPDLALLQVDCLEREDGSEVYPGTVSGQLIGKAGDAKVIMVRQIPTWLPPGRYVLTGWVRIDTSRRSESVTFRSMPFWVVAK